MMNELEWASSEKPEDMLDQLLTGGMRYTLGGGSGPRWSPLATERKLRLFSVGCYRSISPDFHLSCNDWVAIASAEDYADDNGKPLKNHQPYMPLGEPFAPYCASETIRRVNLSQSRIASHIREAFGDPFRPVTLPKIRRCGKCGWDGVGPNRKYCDWPQTFDGKVPHFWKETRPWRTPQVLTLARAAYEEGVGNGRLDEVRLMVLADAIEEKAHLPSLLDDLRSPRERYRGYWALDLILGKA